MAGSVVGVDIGDETLRAVEVAGSRRHSKVLRYGELVLPAGAVHHGEVIEPNTVAGVLRQLWRTAGFSSRKIVLGMGNQRVVARDLTVQKMPMKGIRQALPFQVQDMLPVSVGDALLDFFPISEGEGEHGPVVNGLLVAAVKEAVLANVTAARLAGLSTLDVDLIPFALSRVLVRRPRTTGMVALVDIGAHTTTVLLVKDGVPQFVRIIPAGGDDVTQALATELQLDDAEAEATKRRLGLARQIAGGEDQQAATIIRRVSGELLNSVRNTIAYYANTRPQHPVRHLVLAGGGAQLSGFAAALSELTRLQITEVDPFSTVALSGKIDRADLQRRRTSMSVALGLAVRSLA